jgi:HEAT repeat protein
VRRLFQVAITSAIFAAPLFAQVQTAQIFNRIPIDGASKIAEVLSDPNARLQDKVEGVYRLGELSKDLTNRKDIPASSLYNPILGVMVPQASMQDHHVLRMAACDALARFSSVEGAGQLLPALGRVIQNLEEHEEVRLSAARSIGKFYGNSEAAAGVLITALKREVERGPVSNNVSVTSAIIQSLGGLREKNAFPALMTVIKSNFPTGTKREAQKALENIKW